MATGNHIGVRPTRKRRSPMQGGGVVPPGQGDVGVAGGDKGAFTDGPGEEFDIPVPQNGVAVAYQELDRILRSTTDAFNALHTAAGRIPWESHGKQAATAAEKYDQVRAALEGVAAQVNEIGKNKELVNLLEKVGKVSTTLTGPRGLQVVATAAAAANRGQGLGDPNPNVYSNTGWKAQRLTTGAMDHDAMQLFDSIQAQLRRAYRSGRATIDPGTLEQRKSEIRHLLEEYKGLARAVANNDPGSVSQTKMTDKQLEFFGLGSKTGNLYKLYEDLKAAEKRLNERSIIEPPSSPRVATMGGRISAIGALMYDFRENRNNRSILQAEKLHRAAVEALHDNRENMTRDEYITYRSRLNVYGSQIGTLLQQGKITPREASSAVGGGLRALAAEMNLLKNGGSSLSGVQTRLAEAQALFDANAPYINNPSRLAELQAGLQSRILQVSALGVTPGRTAAQDAIAASAAIRRGFAWTGSYDAAALKAARGGLETQRNLAEAILQDDKTPAAARAAAEKEVSKLTAEMQKLDAVGNKTNGTFARLGRKMTEIAGTALGIYSISHALSMAVAQAVRFDDALRRVDAQLQRLPKATDRQLLGDVIKGAAVKDALAYGMDIDHTLQLHQTAVMGSTGSLTDRSRLGRTLSQLAFTTPTAVGEYQSMISPLTNAGLSAGEINQFFQSSQALQGQLNLAPDRVRAAFSSIAANAAGIGVLTDWETAQALGWHEAAASKDMVMGSKLNRLQMAFRNPRNLLKMQTILSRGGTRENIDGLAINEIISDQNPMLSIDRISRLYKRGAINSQELQAVAQTVDMWSSPGTMNLFKSGLDSWREKIRGADALTEGGFVSTDKMAEEQAQSLQSSVNRIQQSLGNLATGGLNPLGASARALAGAFELATKTMAPVLNFLGTGTIATLGSLAAMRGGAKLLNTAKEAGEGAGAVAGIGRIVGGEGGWKSIRNMSMVGGGIALGVGLAGYAYDSWKRHRDAEIDSLNEVSAGNVLLQQREFDKRGALLQYAQDIRDAMAAGTLTQERQAGIQKEINNLLGTRQVGERLVAELLSGQTTELQKQVGILAGMNRYSEQGMGITALLNMAKAHGAGFNEGPVPHTDPKTALYVARIGRMLLQDEAAGLLKPEWKPILDKTVYMEEGVPTTFREALRNIPADPTANRGAYSRQLLKVMWSSGMTDDPGLLYSLPLVGGGALGKTDEERLRLGHQQAKGLEGRWLASTAQKLAAKLGAKAGGAEIDAWYAGASSEMDVMIGQLVHSGGAISLKQVQDNLAMLLAGSTGKHLAGKGKPLNLEAASEKVLASDELKKFTPGHTDAMSVASYFLNNPWEKKKLSPQADAVINTYLKATVATSAGTATSTLPVEGGAMPSPRFITDLAIKNRGKIELAVRYGNSQLLEEVLSRYDPEKGFSYGVDREGKPIWYTPKEALKIDLARLNKKYKYDYAKELNPAAKEMLTSNYHDQVEDLELRNLEMQAIVSSKDDISKRNRRGVHETLVKLATLGAKDRHSEANAGLLMSGEPLLVKLGELITDLGVAEEELAAAQSDKALKPFGTDAKAREAAGRRWEAQRNQEAMKIKALMFSERASLTDMYQWRDDTSRPVLSFASGEFANNQEATAALNRQISRQIALMEDDYATTEDKIKILKQVVSLEKQKVELDEDVIRARRAMQVGKEVQGQLVETIFSFDGANAAARGKNILGIMGNTVTRGMVDGVGRTLDKYDNPLAKFASFLYDPTGAVNQQVAQQKLTDATLYLAGRIEELTSRLGAQYENMSATATSALGGGLFHGGYGALTGFTLNGGSSAPRALASAAGSAGGTQVFSVPAGDGSGAIKMALGDILASGDSDKIFAAYQKDPNAVGKQLSDLGIAPDADGKYSQETIAANQGAIAEAQAKRQDQARNNPFTGLFGGVQFGTSFWAAGGMGRGKFDPSTGEYTGLGATQSGYVDVNGQEVWQEGSAGISTTGAVVGGAQVLMAGASAYYGNKGNGPAAQNYAALGAASTTAGSLILMQTGAANSWNPVGWALLVVGAIASIMSGFEAAEHKADEANKAYEKQRTEFEKMIAIQEEQKKSIGLMAERVISMRGDVSSNFEGVAASSFLSGRWANRAPQINVATLTVVANNPAELSQALTTALTTQVRQGL